MEREKVSVNKKKNFYKDKILFFYYRQKKQTKKTKQNIVFVPWESEYDVLM